MYTRNRTKMGSAMPLFAVIICCFLMPSRLICADSAPVTTHHTNRDLDEKIEVQPGSKIIRLTITNQSPEVRYLRVPLDLTIFQIILSDNNGQRLRMTRKGAEELTVPATGSVRIHELANGIPRSMSIDLAPLFEFPPTGRIRCEISRLVCFANPIKPPAQSEWVKFPAAMLNL